MKTTITRTYKKTIKTEQPTYLKVLEAVGITILIGEGLYFLTKGQTEFYNKTLRPSTNSLERALE